MSERPLSKYEATPQMKQVIMKGTQIRKLYTKFNIKAGTIAGWSCV